jgi:hypothetical protein
MSTSTYADKIAALLAKAERTDNPHEAEAFSAAAERLMLKWGVDEAMASAAGVAAGRVGAKMVRTDVTTDGVYRVAWQQLLAHMAAGMGGIQVIRIGGSTGNLCAIVGAEGDVARFVQLYTSLRVQAAGAMEQWWKPQRGTGNGSGQLKRRQFILSFGTAVGERLRQERTEIVAETTGAELVLVDRDKAAALAVRDLVGRTRNARTSLKGGGADARTAGWSAGQRANIGGRAAVVS